MQRKLRPCASWFWDPCLHHLEPGTTKPLGMHPPMYTCTSIHTHVSRILLRCGSSSIIFFALFPSSMPRSSALVLCLENKQASRQFLKFRAHYNIEEPKTLFKYDTADHLQVIIVFSSLSFKRNIAKGSGRKLHKKHVSHWPDTSWSSVRGCLLKGSVCELSRCRIMMALSITVPHGNFTGSFISVSIKGSGPWNDTRTIEKISSWWNFGVVPVC